MDFDLLRGPFVDGDQASRRVPKIMQNDANMHLKSQQNEHKKIRIPVSQWIKQKLAIELRAKLHQNAFAFAVPDVALLEEGVPKSHKN